MHGYTFTHQSLIDIDINLVELACLSKIILRKKLIYSYIVCADNCKWCSEISDLVNVLWFVIGDILLGTIYMYIPHA